jgi:polyribonucleotide nucleotidyltransferase
MGKLGTVEHIFEIDGKEISFEGGLLAQQAGGAVITSLADVKVLTTTTASRNTKEFLGFFPLTIEVEERQYASGQIPGSFFKREGRPSTDAILTCRLTDRPMRPTFADGLRNEIQVVNTVLQTTKTDPYDVIAMNGASTATMLAGIPFAGPIGSVRYAMMRDGSWIAFPSYEELESECVFNMIVAGRVTDDGEVAILMIEAEATDDSYIKVEMGASAPDEKAIGAAIESVKPVIRQLCEEQEAFIKKMGGGRPLGEFKYFLDYTDEVLDKVLGLCMSDVEAVYADGSTSKEAKSDALSVIKTKMLETFNAGLSGDDDAEDLGKQASQAFRSVEKKVVRKMIVSTKTRIDGRGLTDLRKVTCEVGVLPKTHGSAIFQRGETQSLSVLALGSTRDNQRLDTLSPVTEKYYMHHYNMPPWSTGETGRVGSPKRREIGHGMLGERALVPVLPPMDEWPYTMRIVTDLMGSNGSTSMASVCGSTLALMDGGVPIQAPVAGIAMGLISEGDEFITLTDIQGVEDFYGDMDFKVAGTREFVTALQLDTKLTGIPAPILAAALLQAKVARDEILDIMEQTIAEPRDEVAEGAPRLEVVSIPQDKIGEVIGPRGKIIKELVEQTGAQIDIEEEGGRGIVRIYGKSAEQVNDAVSRVNAIANPVLPEAGERYHATVVKTVDFGAFVSLTPGIDGLLHISALSKMAGKRLNHGEEATNVGDQIWVEVKEVLDGGRRFKLEYVDDEGNAISTEGGGGGDRSGGGDRGGRSGGGDRDRGGDRGGRSGGGDRGGRSGGGDRGGRSERDERPAKSESRDNDGAERDERPAKSESRDNDGAKRDERPAKSESGDNDGGRTRTRTRTRSRE